MILSTTSISGEISPDARADLGLWKAFGFLAVNGALFYYLLGRLGSRGLDKTYFERLTEESVTGSAYAEVTGLLCYANVSFLRMFDLSHAAIGQVLIQDLLRDRVGSIPADGLLPTFGSVEMTARTRLGDGRQLEMLVSITAETGQNEGYLIAASEISELQQLKSGHAVVGAALDGLSHGLIVCDATRAGLPILFANAVVATMMGYDMADLIGAPWSMLQGPERDQPGITQIRAALEQRSGATTYLRNYRRDGSAFLNEVYVSPIMDRDGRLTQVACLLRDVTIEQGMREAVDHSRYADNITSLLNRPGFYRALEQMLFADESGHVLVVRLNIRNFHDFNTALGWDCGDALLTELGRRLSRALPGAAVGRIYADQYSAVLPTTLADADGTVERIRQAISGRYVLPGVTCDPVIAIGYTVAPLGSNIRQVMQQASVAVKEAWTTAAAETRRFDSAMQSRISERQRLMAELQVAVLDRNFVVYFLPEVELASGRPVAAEALVRWSHPLFGMQYPAGFVALAEETGLILEIGDVVLSTAAKVAARINQAGRPPARISVNMSLAEMRRSGVVQSIERALHEAGASPEWLQIEMRSDTVALATPETQATFSRLRQAGIGLAIDDFGAGNSSVGYLARSPVEKIKIDRSFVRGIESAPLNQTVVKAILNIGAIRDIVVVAEGVETQAEREALIDLGCVYAQGFLFSQAVAEHELGGMFAAGSTLPRRGLVPS